MQWRYFGIQFAYFPVERILEEGSGDVWSSRYMSAALELGIPIEIFLLETGEGVGGEDFEGLSLNKGFVRGIWNG